MGKASRVFSSRMVSVKTVGAISLLTLFSCSIPFLGKGRLVSPEEGNVPKSSKISGVIEFHEGCNPGYYKVTLKGLFENADVQVEAQTDSLGKFNVTAPPGKYLASISKDNCGTKEVVTLENNTEHMFSFSVQETRSIERIGTESHQFPSRLPASVLVPVKAN